MEEIDMTAVVDITLLSVEKQGDIIVVQRELTFADGSTFRGKHAFPNDTLEWRAAEYGIDPSDLDALLDIVIHEPFLGDPDQPELSLYDAATVEEARDYHLARINAVKDRSKKPRRTASDPARERIKELSVMHPEAIALKREHVVRGRNKQQKLKEERVKAGLRAIFVEPSVPEEARLQRLRAKLTGDRPTATTRGKKNG